MSTIEQRLQRLEDEAAIRDLAARFADAATRADIETIRTLFKPDGVFTIGEPFAVTCKGVDEIVALLHKLRDGKDFFVHFVHSGLIQVDGDTASARWLIREVGLGPAKSGPGKSYYNNFGANGGGLLEHLLSAVQISFVHQAIGETVNDRRYRSLIADFTECGQSILVRTLSCGAIALVVQHIRDILPCSGLSGTIANVDIDCLCFFGRL